MTECWVKYQNCAREKFDGLALDCQHLKLLLAWTGCASNKRASASLRRDIHTHITTDVPVAPTSLKFVRPAPMSGETLQHYGSSSELSFAPHIHPKSIE